MRIAHDIKPSGKASSSQGSVLDQKVTYSQSFVTYDDIRYDYGGFYGFSDILPIISRANTPIPSLSGGGDIYKIKPAPPIIGINNGPGFLMFINL